MPKPAAARTGGGSSLASGFGFSDFALVDPESEEAKRLLAIAPDMAKYIRR
jgi:hypothetical protein